MKEIKKITKAMVFIFTIFISAVGVADNLKPEIVAIKNNHQLVLFADSRCVHCQRFMPVFRKFVADYGINFFVFSVVEEASNDPQFVQAFFNKNPTTVPALFLITNVKSKDKLKIYPVAIGEMVYEALEQRMQRLSIKVIEHEKNGE